MYIYNQLLQLHIAASPCISSYLKGVCTVRFGCFVDVVLGLISFSYSISATFIVPMVS